MRRRRNQSGEVITGIVLIVLWILTNARPQ